METANSVVCAVIKDKKHLTPLEGLWLGVGGRCGQRVSGTPATPSPARRSQRGRAGLSLRRVLVSGRIGLDLPESSAAGGKGRGQQVALW